MRLDRNEVIKIGKLMEASQTFLVISHKNPDGDTIGAGLGLYHALTGIGKQATWFCQDPPSEEFNFLPEVQAITHQIKDPKGYDAVFVVDAGATHLTGLDESHPQLFDKSLEVVNIDHHVSNNFYGKYNLVLTQAAAATEVVYELLTALSIPISRAAATCLLTGLYTDTGSFMHSNTSPDVMRIASRLLAKGADLRNIAKQIFNTKKVSTLRLWGRVLKSTHQSPEGITMSVVTKKDFEETGADYSEMTGVVDYVNSVPGAKYSVILTEKEEAGRGPVVKGSLRTLNKEVDVAKVASQFGGGGHTKAAGFTVKGRLEKEVRWKVVGGSD